MFGDKRAGVWGRRTCYDLKKKKKIFSISWRVCVHPGISRTRSSPKAEDALREINLELPQCLQHIQGWAQNSLHFSQCLLNWCWKHTHLLCIHSQSVQWVNARYLSNSRRNETESARLQFFYWPPEVGFKCEAISIDLHVKTLQQKKMMASPVLCSSFICTNIIKNHFKHCKLLK